MSTYTTYIIKQKVYVYTYIISIQYFIVKKVHEKTWKGRNVLK